MRWMTLPRSAGSTPTDSRNLRFDYGDSSYDVRHTFTSYITYELPAPAWGPRRLVRGWQLNSLLSFYSGLPFTVTRARTSAARSKVGIGST